MESQHMTQQVFADFIGVGAATLSSIFNDRTRPTLNIVEAIKKKIPNINTDMYQADHDADNAPSAPSTESQRPGPGMLDFDSQASPTPINVVSQYLNSNSVRNTRPEIVREEVKIVDKPQRRVIEIRVFYDDQTWDTFVPAKK